MSTLKNEKYLKHFTVELIGKRGWLWAKMKLIICGLGFFLMLLLSAVFISAADVADGIEGFRFLEKENPEPLADFISEERIAYDTAYAGSGEYYDSSICKVYVHEYASYDEMKYKIHHNYDVEDFSEQAMLNEEPIAFVHYAPAYSTYFWASSHYIILIGPNMEISNTPRDLDCSALVEPYMEQFTPQFLDMAEPKDFKRGYFEIGLSDGKKEDKTPEKEKIEGVNGVWVEVLIEDELSDDSVMKTEPAQEERIVVDDKDLEEIGGPVEAPPPDALKVWVPINKEQGLGIEKLGDAKVSALPLDKLRLRMPIDEADGEITKKTEEEVHKEYGSDPEKVKQTSIVGRMLSFLRKLFLAEGE